MKKEYKDYLISIGRKDIVADYELERSGYAGIDNVGNLVDRRQEPGALPIQESLRLGIPKPKEIKLSVHENDPA